MIYILLATAILFVIGAVIFLVCIEKAIDIAKDIDFFYEARKDAAEKIIGCIEEYIKEQGGVFDEADAKAMVLTIKEVFGI